MKYYVIFALVILWVTPGVCQDYHAFPTDSAYWDFGGWDVIMDPAPNEQYCVNYRYALRGDTILNGTTYSKLYSNGPQELYFDNCGIEEFYLQQATYQAALREDSTKKIWIREAGDTTEMLYWDFALDTGDTFCFDYISQSWCLPVSKIDSILISGDYRKQIHFQSYDTWIEGIGGWKGLEELHKSAGASWFACFTDQREQILHKFEDLFSCGNITDVEPLSASDEAFKIHPNPVTKTNYITINHISGDQYYINMYTMLGQNIRSVKTYKEKTLIDTYGLNEGVYLIVIIDKQGERWAKRVIINAP